MPTPPPAPLILASTSPYRRELLARLGLVFEVLAPDVDETPAADESPERTAARLAQSKAHAVLARRPEAVVIGSDQVADLDGIRLHKPGTPENARRQLALASGREVRFHTAVCVAAAHAVHVDLVTTTVRFRELDADAIARYVERDTPLDCAGSARSEGLGIALLERMDGPDPTALVGLPLIAVATALRKHGFVLP